MKHEMTIDFRTMYNIVCAAAAFYKECQLKFPEIFDEQDANELRMARKLRNFCVDTSAMRFTIKDQD